MPAYSSGLSGWSEAGEAYELSSKLVREVAEREHAYDSAGKRDTGDGRAVVILRGRVGV